MHALQHHPPPAPLSAPSPPAAGEGAAAAAAALKDRVCVSDIECGELIDGERVYKRYMEYFNAEVEIFFAVADPTHTPLYRPVLMSEKLGCHNSRIGMFIHRRRAQFKGIYQASGFCFKSPGVIGLKLGAYFVSMETCLKIEEWFNSNKNRRCSNQDTDKSSVSHRSEATDMDEQPTKKPRKSRKKSVAEKVSALVAIEPTFLKPFVKAEPTGMNAGSLPSPIFAGFQSLLSSPPEWSCPTEDPLSGGTAGDFNTQLTPSTSELTEKSDPETEVRLILQRSYYINMDSLACHSMDAISKQAAMYRQRLKRSLDEYQFSKMFLD